MFVNVNKIHGKLKALGLTVEDAAERMGIDRSTLYRKLKNNGAGLTVKDAQMLVDILQLTELEALEIFFAREVA
jgi:transcriptional regulator with XRE-family HTH domain